MRWPTLFALLLLAVVQAQIMQMGTNLPKGASARAVVESLMGVDSGTGKAPPEVDIKLRHGSDSKESSALYDTFQQHIAHEPGIPLEEMEDTSPELAEKLERFYKWLFANGVEGVDNVRVAMFPSTGRGLMSNLMMPPNGELFSISRRVQLHSDHLYTAAHTQHAYLLEPFLANATLTRMFPKAVMELMIAVWLEDCKGPDSFWRPYLDTLPERYDMPLCFPTFNASLLDNLPPTLAGVARQRLDMVKMWREEVFLPLGEVYPDLFPAECYSLERMLYGACTVTSRGVGGITNKLMPLGDMCNTGLTVPLAWITEDTTWNEGILRFRSQTMMNAASQYFIRYVENSLAASAFYMRYGVYDPGRPEWLTVYMNFDKPHHQTLAFRRLLNLTEICTCTPEAARLLQPEEQAAAHARAKWESETQGEATVKEVQTEAVEGGKDTTVPDVSTLSPEKQALFASLPDPQRSCPVGVVGKYGFLSPSLLFCSRLYTMTPAELKQKGLKVQVPPLSTLANALYHQVLEGKLPPFNTENEKAALRHIITLLEHLQSLFGRSKAEERSDYERYDWEELTTWNEKTIALARLTHQHIIEESIQNAQRKIATLDNPEAAKMNKLKLEL